MSVILNRGPLAAIQTQPSRPSKPNLSLLKAPKKQPYTAHMGIRVQSLSSGMNTWHISWLCSSSTQFTVNTCRKICFQDEASLSQTNQIPQGACTSSCHIRLMKISFYRGILLELLKAHANQGISPVTLGDFNFSTSISHCCSALTLIYGLRLTSAYHERFLPRWVSTSSVSEHTGQLISSIP